MTDDLGAGRGRRPREAVGLRVRRRRPLRRHRGGHDRARGVGVRGVRRHPGRGAGPRPGLQAGRRRRHRPEHRRHGRLLAPGVAARRLRRGHRGPLRRADPGRAAPARDRLPRAALRRADGHARRAQAGRVQHPLRRPRQPGRAAPADVGPRRAAGRGGRRRAGQRADLRRRRPRSSWSPPPRATRPRPAPATSSRASTAAQAVEGATVLCAGRRPPTPRAGSSPPGGGCSRSSGQGPDVAAARARAYEALGHLSWPGMHHRTDIAREVSSP